MVEMRRIVIRRLAIALSYADLPRSRSEKSLARHGLKCAYDFVRSQIAQPFETLGIVLSDRFKPSHVDCSAGLATRAPMSLTSVAGGAIVADTLNISPNAGK